MTNPLINWFCLFLIASFFFACEKEYLPSSEVYKKQVVVESVLELGNGAMPAYCILTYSFAFNNSFDTGFINNLYVKNAQVVISKAGEKYELTEFCLNDLQEPFRSQILEQLGFNPDSVVTNFCVYVDASNQIKPQPGDQFDLQVITGGDTLNSTTSVPGYNSIDSFWFEKPAGRNNNDTFAQLYCIISDNPLTRDFYRYFTAGQGERLIPNIGSVTDDVFFDGQSFKFPLNKAVGLDDDFGAENSGYFRRGDTVTIKWCTLPYSHYQFWNSLEAGRTRQGPFAPYVRTESNINNGLGIFGAQNCRYYTLVVPK